MALTYVGGNSNVGTGATISVSLTALTGGSDSSAAAGDIVVVTWGWATNVGADASLTMSTADYNYAFADVWANDTREANMRMAWKAMGSTPDTEAVCNGPNNGAYGGGIAVQVWRGARLGTTLTGTASATSALNGNHGNPPAITPAVNDAVVIVGMVGSGATTATGVKTAPTNYTTYDVATKGDGTGADAYIAISARLLSGGSGASEDPGAYSGGSTTTSDGWCAGTLALQPAPTKTLTETAGLGDVLTAQLPAVVTAAETATLGHSTLKLLGIVLMEAMTLIDPTVTTQKTGGAGSYSKELTESVALSSTVRKLTSEFPIRVHSSGRYFEDATGIPIFVHGNTVWELTKNLTLAEAQTVLDSLKARGFNAVIVSIPGCYDTSKGASYPTTMADQQSESPFTSGLTPNEDYWAHVDDVMDEIQSRGMLCFFSGSYLGYSDADGIRTLLAAQTDAACTTYGEFLGTRYGGYGNIVWTHGGDTNPTTWASKVHAIRDGIDSTDADALHGTHWNPDVDPWSYTGTLAVADLDVWNAYSYTQPLHSSVSDAYDYATTKPVIAYETQYEDEEMTGLPSSAEDVAPFPYRSVLAGACGHFFGNDPLWFAGDSSGGWSAALSSTGHVYMGYVPLLFNADRPWWKLVPQRPGTLLVSGHGDPDLDTGVQAALSSDSTFAMAFVPTTSALTVNLGVVNAGSAVSAWWFNVRTGAYTFINTYSASGNQSFTAPSADRNVLVLDSHQARTETLGLSATLRLASSRQLVEATVLSDTKELTESAGDFTKELSDTAQLSATLSRQVSYQRTLTEAAGLSDTPSKNTRRTLEQYLWLIHETLNPDGAFTTTSLSVNLSGYPPTAQVWATDFVANSGNYENFQLSWSSSGPWTASIRFHSVVGSMLLVYVKGTPVGGGTDIQRIGFVTVEDQSQLVEPYTETVGLTRSLTKVASLTRQLVETLGLSDSIQNQFSGGSNNYTKTLTEAAGLTDAAVKGAGKQLTDSLLAMRGTGWEPNPSYYTFTDNSFVRSAVNGINGTARSIEALAGDCWVQFVPFASNKAAGVGLSNDIPTNTNSYEDIDFFIQTGNDGIARVYENTSFRTSLGAYTATDVFKIHYQQRTRAVTYYKNGARVYTSPSAPTSPFYVCGWAFEQNAGVGGIYWGAAEKLSLSTGHALLDGLALAESLQKFQVKLLTEGVGLADSLQKARVGVLTEVVGLGDLTTKAAGRTTSEAITLSDQLTTAKSKELVESLALTDSCSKGTVEGLVESLALSRTVTQAGPFTLLSGLSANLTGTPPTAEVYATDFIQTSGNYGSFQISLSESGPWGSSVRYISATGNKTVSIKGSPLTGGGAGGYPTIAGFAGWTDNNNRTSTDIDVGIAGTPAAGDLVIVLITKDGTGAFTWPATPEFTELGGFPLTHNSVTSARYRIWQTGDSATFSITHSTEGTAYQVYRITGYSGVPTAGGSATTGDSTNPNPGDCAPGWGAEDILWIALAGSDGNTSSSAAPADFTDFTKHVAISSSSTYACSISSARRFLNAASLDAGAFTSATEQWGAAVIAVRPAAGGAPDKIVNTSLTITDTNQLATSYEETAGLADTLTRTAAFARTPTELVGLVDETQNQFSGGAQSYTKQLTEVTGLGDSLQKQSSFSRQWLEALGLSDQLTKSRTLLRAESLGLADSTKKAVGRTVGEQLVSTDRLTRGHVKQLAELVGLGDQLSGGKSKQAIELVGLGDSLRKGPGRQRTEVATLSDSLQKQQSRQRTEVVSLGDSPRKDTRRTLTEGVSLADTLTGRALQKTLTEGMGLTATPSKGEGRTLVEAAGLGSTLSLTQTQKQLSERLSLSDVRETQHGGNSTKQLPDPVQLSDTFSRQVAYQRTFVETSSLADTLRRGEGRTLSEAIGLTDSRLRGVGKQRVEALSLTDSARKSPARTLVEGVALADSLRKQPSRQVGEQLGLADSLRLTQTQKQLAELLGLSDVRETQHGGNSTKELSDLAQLTDSFSRQVGYQRTLTEGVALADTVTEDGSYLKQLTETASLTDSLTRGVGKQRVEAATLAATPTRGLGRILTEGLSVADPTVTTQHTPYSSGAYTKTLTDVVGLSDSLTRQAGYARTLTEGAALLDSLQKGAGKQRTESLSLTASLTTTKAKVLSEALGLGGLLTRQVAAGRTLIEVASLADVADVAAETKILGDTATLSDGIVKGLSRELTETASLTESFNAPKTLTDGVLLEDFFEYGFNRTKDFIQYVPLVDTLEVVYGLAGAASDEQLVLEDSRLVEMSRVLTETLGVRSTVAAPDGYGVEEWFTFAG